MNTKSIQMTWLSDSLKKGTKNIIRSQIEKVDNLERSTLLDKTNSKWRNVIPFSVTFSRILPNIRKKISIIHSEMKFKAIIGFRKNTSLRQIIGTNVISHN